MFSISRMHDTSHPAHGSARNGYVYWAGMGTSSLLERVSRVDDRRVRFTLTRPDATFLSLLAMPTIGSVYPAEYAQQLLKAGKPEQLNTLPVGSGPFVFRSYQKDAVVRYAANKAWWGGAPKIDNLVFAITVDADTRAQRVKAEKCLVGVDMKAQSVAAFETHPRVSIVKHTPLVTSYLTLNTQHAGLSDVRLREALWLAIDKKTYMQASYAGFATAATSFLPPGMWSRDAGLPDRHDPERAKQLVKASGYDGRELTMFFANGGSRLRAAELMQADWAKVGIRVRTRAMEQGEMYKRSGEGEHDIVLLSWYGDNGDPDNFFGPNLSCAAVESGGNKSRRCNPRLDELLKAATRTSDRKQRAALYVQAQRIVYDEVSIIPLAHGMVMTAVNRRVRGFVPSPFGSSEFRHASVD